MTPSVQYIPGPDWEANFAAAARRAVFQEALPPEFDRVDFALLVTREESVLGYITVREFDADSAYLKHGGAFPPAEKSVYALSAYRAAIEWLRSRYKRLTTLVENNNVTYLKIALTEGFLPIGIRYFKSAILLELLLERAE